MLLISNMYPSKENPTFGIFVYNQVEALRDLGVDFELVVNKERRTGLYNLKKYASLAWRVFIKSLSLDFDLVHAHFLFPPAFLAIFPAAVKKKPLIVTAHGSDVVLGEKSGLLNFCIRQVLRRAKRAIFVSEDLRRKAEGVYSFEPEKSSVVPVGIDVNLFQPHPKDACRKELGLPLEAKILIYVGNFKKYKGPQVALEAFSQIARDFPQTYLLMIGDGPERASLEELAERSGVREKVIFTGYVRNEEIPKWLSASDIFVLSSFREAFGLSALESMACGVPVVVSEVGGLKEFVVPGESGLFADPNNPKSFAEGFKRLLSDEGLYERLREGGLKTAAKFSLNKQAKKVFSIYKEVL